MSASEATDEQKIREVIDTWATASADGDLIALTNLMTEDVMFLTPGQPPHASQRVFRCICSDEELLYFQQPFPHPGDHDKRRSRYLLESTRSRHNASRGR